VSEKGIKEIGVSTQLVQQEARFATMTNMFLLEGIWNSKKILQQLFTLTD